MDALSFYRGLRYPEINLLPSSNAFTDALIIAQIVPITYDHLYGHRFRHGNDALTIYKPPVWDEAHLNETINTFVKREKEEQRRACTLSVAMRRSF